MYKKIICFSIIMFSASFSVAQSQVDVLEQRVQYLENYIQQLQPTFEAFSKNVETGLTAYTSNLEKGLEEYSLNLENRVEERFKLYKGHAAILDSNSQASQKVETNVSDFLISVDRSELIRNGIRLYLNIGNPNNASYKGFKLKIMWGDKYPNNSSISYPNWRKTLTGAEYSFEGRLEKGLWIPVQVDLSPAVGTLSNMYIECEMEVLSVELQSPKAN